jgi:spermidine synthase
VAGGQPGRLAWRIGGGAGSPGGAADGQIRRLLFLAVCGLGISAILTQLVLMRELLNVFAGNEMIFGILLGNWFLLTGLGSFLGRSSGRLTRPVVWLVVAQVLIAILPVADVFLLRALRNVVFVRGAEVGVTETVFSCFVLLLPYCLIAGYLLTLACTVLASRQEAASIGRVYFLDVLGDIAGGVLFSFVLIHLLDHLGSLYVPAALNLALAVLVAAAVRRRLLAACVGVLALGAVVAAAAVDLDRLTTSMEYAGQDVVYKGNSPYGKLVVTASGGQYSFFENGVPLFTTEDVQRVEETVHYAMAQRPAARRVLLIGGGVSGTAQEVLKYPVKAVDYVELDPLIVKVGRRFLPQSLADARIRVHHTDGRLFVRQAGGRYDVIVADVPDPSTSQLNRLYTAEFFAEVRRRLAPQGVLAVSVGVYENYLSEELAGLIGVTDRTLRESFRNVLILPGGRVYFLASDGELTSDVAGRVEAAGVATQYVTRAFLRGTLTPDRLLEVERAAGGAGGVNRDFSPVLYYRHLLYWISRFRVRLGVLEAALILALGLYLARMRPVPRAIFTTGFAASALEVVLLMGFQIIHGCVYHKVGLIVTMFMVGLAAGSFAANRWLTRWRRRDLAKLEFAVAAFAGLVPLALLALDRLPGPMRQTAWAEAAFPLLAGLLAVLVGMEFPVAGRADFRTVATTASRLYTADYIGACVGALLVSTLLIPLIGVLAVCMIAAAMNLATGLAIRLARGG